MMERSGRIGVGVVGTGRIGAQRARLAAQHPAVGFLALMDSDRATAAAVAERLHADLVTDTVGGLVADDRVDAVIVSTPEQHHTEAAVEALAARKPVLVEKPIALTLADADAILTAAASAGVDARVGYSMRYVQRYAVGWENVSSGGVGAVAGITGRVYSTRAQGLAILERSATATPVVDIVTYLVDAASWYLAPQLPVEVVARGHGTVFRSHGYDVDDVAWALIRFSEGTVVDLGVCYMLPVGFPTAGQSIRFEVYGNEGAMLIDDDHRDAMMYTEHGYTNAYASRQELDFAFLGSRTSGEWVGDTMFGRLANETRAWLDHVVTGGACHLTTLHEARRVLAVTLAIETSLRTGEAVTVDAQPAAATLVREPDTM
jgi:predicted dehydrogenase